MKRRLLSPGLPVVLGILFLLTALWYYFDISLSASLLQAPFLKKQYILLFAAGALFLSLCWFLFYQSRLPLENIFFILSVGLGCLYMGVFQGLSAPDEAAHYITAYKLSSQITGKPATVEDGHVIIDGDLMQLESYSFPGSKRPSWQGPDSTPILGQFLDAYTYRDVAAWERGSGDPMPSSQPPVRTTPAVYIPQVAGFLLARALGGSAILLIRLGKFFNLLLFSLLMAAAIRRLPFGKGVLFGVGLLPMSLHLAASLSYDASIIALCSYFIALVLSAAYEKEIMTAWDWMGMLFSGALFAPCKLVYLPLIFLYFLIPVKKCKSPAHYYGGFLFLAALVFLHYRAVNLRIIEGYADAVENTVGWLGEPGYTFRELLSAPRHTLKLVINSIFYNSDFYLITMLGGYLGQIDKELQIPFFLLLFYGAGLLLMSVGEERPKGPVRGGRDFFFILFLTAMMTGGIFLSMLLAWTPRVSPVINGVQGRYFLPFLLPVLVLWGKQKGGLPKEAGRKWLYGFALLHPFFLLRLYALVALRL